MRKTTQKMGRGSLMNLSQSLPCPRSFLGKQRPQWDDSWGCSRGHDDADDADDDRGRRSYDENSRRVAVEAQHNRTDNLSYLGNWGRGNCLIPEVQRYPEHHETLSHHSKHLKVNDLGDDANSHGDGDSGNGGHGNEDPSYEAKSWFVSSAYYIHTFSEYYLP